VQPNIVQLIRLQSYDGSFAMTEGLKAIIGEAAMREGDKLGVDSTIWATAVAAAYGEKHLSGQRETLDNLLEKIREYVKNRISKEEFDDLVDRAKQLVI